MIALLALAFARSLLAAEDIKPPFGLRWGETPERLEMLLKGAKATIVERHMVGDRQAWTVEGIVHTGLRRTVLYIKSNGLVEVELQYQNAAWDTAKYDDFMAKVRQTIEDKFGPGQLIARSKKPEGEITQTIVGYKWTQTTTSIQLIYFAAEDANQIYRTVSVHYKIQ